MTPIERKLLRTTGALGVALTVLVVALVAVGGLDPLERWLYDRRARDNQWFTPRPTDQLVHVDIDDLSLESIGQWPWPRDVHAAIVGELDRAGAKVIGFDIVFAEPQRVQYEPTDGDGQFRKVDHDQQFADAVQRHGNVILPMQAAPVRPRSAVYQAALAVLTDDVTLNQGSVIARLAGDAVIERSEQLDEDTFLRAKRQAMFNRLHALLLDDPDLPRDEARGRLLPDEGGVVQTVGTLEQRVFAEQFNRARSFALLAEHGKPSTPHTPASLPVTPETASVPVLSAAAARTGFVDYVRQPDGVVRDVPMWAEMDGRLYPFLGLALACAQRDIDPADARIDEDTVALPTPDGEIRLPVHRRYSHEHGYAVGALLQVPWFGPTERWELMYDWDEPRFEDSAQHMKAVNVYAVYQLRQEQRQNCRHFDEALVTLRQEWERTPGLDGWPTLGPAGPGDVDARLRQIEKVLAACGPQIEQERRQAEQFIQVRLMAERQTLESQREQGQELTDAQIEQHLKQLEQRLRAENEGGAVMPGKLAVVLDAYRRSFVNNRQTLEAQEAALRQTVDGKAVLIGFTAFGTTDTVPTSLHAACPGVVVHGVVFNAVMTGDTLTIAPLWTTLAITLLIGLLTTAAAAAFTPGKALAAALVLGVGWLVGNGIVLFDYANIVIGVAGPLIVVGLVWSGCTLNRVIFERAERQRIKGRFQSYVDPVLVDYVMEHPERAHFDGERRELTVVYTDIAGFTTLSERLQERVVPLLNEYMGVMVPLVHEHGGYLNKFLGDGIMFFCGAPRHNDAHAADAIATVLRMQQAMGPFNQRLAERKLPRLQMRVGVATGSMIVGDAGPAERSDYTVLGPMANLGARLESANKHTGTLILANDRAAERTRELFLFSPVAKLRVVGVDHGVMTYEPLAFLKEATDRQKRQAELWSGVVDAFVAGRFAQSLEAIHAMDREIGVVKLTELYRELNEQYLRDPPGDGFDGSIVLESK